MGAQIVGMGLQDIFEDLARRLVVSAALTIERCQRDVDLQLRQVGVRSAEPGEQISSPIEVVLPHQSDGAVLQRDFLRRQGNAVRTAATGGIDQERQGCKNAPMQTSASATAMAVPRQHLCITAFSHSCTACVQCFEPPVAGMRPCE
jgi:hypothetical protein